MLAHVRNGMTAVLRYEDRLFVYEMMERLGIEPGAGALPRLACNMRRHCSNAPLAAQEKPAAIGSSAQDR
jgi:hypothetical protein